jgi:hypothetical protein
MGYIDPSIRIRMHDRQFKFKLPVQINLTEGNNYGIMYRNTTHNEVYVGKFTDKPDILQNPGKNIDAVHF